MQVLSAPVPRKRPKPLKHAANQREQCERGDSDWATRDEQPVRNAAAEQRGLQDRLEQRRSRRGIAVVRMR
eukprot:3826388-Pleurochrysis_carterae.AAC.1